MKKIFSLFALIAFSPYAFAVAPDIRISDDSGNVLNINSDGTVPVSGGGSAISAGKNADSATGTYGIDADPYHVFIGGDGGDTTIATTGVGGHGGSIVSIGGIGGRATAATTSSTGGIGGTILLEGGEGGQAIETGTNIGGAGGSVQIFGGNGGAASGGSSNTNGAGGNIFLRAGFNGGGTGTGGDIIIGKSPDGRTSGGNIGIFTLSPLYSVHQSISSATASLQHVITNESSSTSAAAEFDIQNNNLANAQGSFKIYSSGFSGSLFGVTVANTVNLLGSGSQLAGMNIGNTTAKPIVLGTNNAENLRIASGGHIETKGTVPSIASGFGTSPSIVGNDNNGQVTVGTGGSATTGTINFASTWANAPMCVANHQGAILPVRAVATTTQLTIDASSAFTASGVIDFQCRGRN